MDGDAGHFYRIVRAPFRDCGGNILVCLKYGFWFLGIHQSQVLNDGV